MKKERPLIHIKMLTTLFNKGIILSYRVDAVLIGSNYSV